MTVCQVYSISDVVRGAEHVIIIAGNPEIPSPNDSLREWGERVWTLPEVLLAKGDSIGVYDYRKNRRQVESISKAQFPTQVWPDPTCSRQLIEHFTNLHLSRLELVKVAVECLMNLRFKPMYAGDRSYALMGLLRLRPPIDRNDSSFQAFAR